jgi:hypothetical protein
MNQNWKTVMKVAVPLAAAPFPSRSPDDDAAGGGVMGPFGDESSS